MSLKPYTWRHAIMKSGLPSTTRLVLFGVSFHVTDAGEAACVSTAQLANETGLSERAVISHLKSVDGNWIAIRRHGFGDQRWARNEYLPRLPGDPSLDVKGTERPSVPPAEIVGEGTERPSVPPAEIVGEGTERHDTKALNVVQGDNGFDFKLYPPKPPTDHDLLDSPEAELERWFAAEFWKRYPLKVARTTAWRAVRRLKPDAALRAAILAGLDRSFEQRKRAEARREFVPAWPHPASWVNARRWEDEAPSDSRETKRDDRRCWACPKPAVAVASGKPHCRDHNPIFHSEGARP